MSGGLRYAVLWVLALALGLTLAGCGRTTMEVPADQGSDPAEAETEKPRPETGMVPAADVEDPEDGTEGAAAPQLPAPAASSPAAPSAPEPRDETEELPDSLPYVCYDGLYTVDYDPHVFTPGPSGGADLVKGDGTEAFFARLTSQALIDTWLAGMEEKGQYQQYLSYESHTERAAGFPVSAIVYRDETAWHAEAVVELGEDRGSEALPMYAVYFTCDGPSRDAVWTDGVRAFLSTLRLGEK